MRNIIILKQQSLEDEAWLGKLAEGLVISHLRSHSEIPFLKTAQTFTWFYYDKSGKEIDAIVKYASNFIGLEVKFQRQVDFRDIKKISPVRHYVLLTRDDILLQEYISMIPVDVFLSLLPSSERNI